MNPKIGRKVGKLSLLVRKNIPNITTAASVAGVVGTAVLSARAAYKSVDALKEHKNTLNWLHANKTCFDDEQEYHREVAAVYKDIAKDLAKAYWPAALSSGLTIAGIFTTNSVHRKRYLTMAGMYTAAMSAYADYRKRVEEKYGSEVERELYYNLQHEEVVTVETDKKGKEKTKVDIVTTPGESDPTFNTILMDPSDKGWYYKRPETTYYVLTGIENTMTQKLRAKGYLFLNEVLDALDKPEIPEGQFIGWIFDENRDETDNVVDFGLREDSPRYDPENVNNFLTGKNEFLYLTLNHDGTIYDKFPSFDRVRIRDNARRV